MCFRFRQFYLKSIQVDRLVYCFNLSKKIVKIDKFRFLQVCLDFFVDKGMWWQVLHETKVCGSGRSFHKNFSCFLFHFAFFDVFFYVVI